MKKSPQPTYVEKLPADANPGDTAICEGYLWRCSQYSRNQPDAIKWRILKKMPGKAEMKTHFLIRGSHPRRHRYWRACNMLCFWIMFSHTEPNPEQGTFDPEKVDCANCRKTKAFKDRKK